MTSIGSDRATRVMLCGVSVPHDHGLVGHSDADVGLHVLCDAIYGAMAEGDIGRHFPPSDSRWKGTDSAVFLRHAADLARSKGYRITALDVTLICERPKIGPHADAMRARIGDIAGLEAERVSVKATTTEGLGFAGRGEGIAAMATATACAMIASLVATVGGVGHLRPAPGTWGSAAALPMAFLVMQAGAAAFTLACLAAIAVGLWATAAVTAGRPDHDPSEVVIDEVAGQWVALLPVAWGAQAAGAPVLALWPGWIAAFALFRLFDIWKPGPVGWADRKATATGVVLDDVIAGAMAAAGVCVLAALAHAL